MRRLAQATLGDVSAEVHTPDYDRGSLRVGIIHFGVGNFHRSHQAVYLDRLLSMSPNPDWGICGVGMMERDRRMGDVLKHQDHLYSLTVRHNDGAAEQRVVGSIIDYRFAPDEPSSVIDLLADASVRIVSLTITESGYVADPTTGRVAADNPQVAAEVESGLKPPLTVFGYIVAGLLERRREGMTPFTVLSCDNIQGNGRVARESVLGVAELIDEDLSRWVHEEVAFPNSMVDRITPATSAGTVAEVADLLRVLDEWPVVCEEFTQWVLEDSFPSGRPPLESVGVTFVDEIDAYEAIKLRLLNGSHQAMAYLGQLLGYRRVDEACRDSRIIRLLHAYLDEARQTLEVPIGFDVDAYIEQLLERFRNPYIRDTLARLSVDSTDRITKFVLPVILDRVADGRGAVAGAVIIASWIWYCKRALNGDFMLDDPYAEILTETVAAMTPPSAMLSGIPVLRRLSQDADFSAAFMHAFVPLEQDDIGAALRPLPEYTGSAGVPGPHTGP